MEYGSVYDRWVRIWKMGQHMGSGSGGSVYDRWVCVRQMGHGMAGGLRYLTSVSSGNVLVDCHQVRQWP